MDSSIIDAQDLGRAMAPACAETLRNHLHDFSCSVDDYDLILTGDLSKYGSEAFKKMVKAYGIELKDNYNFIYIGSSGLERENMKISLSNNKGKIEYCIYNTGEIRKYLTEYKVTSWDLENDNLDLRKFLDYDIVTNQCIEKIKTINKDKCS